MNGLLHGVDLAGGTVALQWEKMCRDEDMRQRLVDNIRYDINEARRSVDEKTQQLKAISHLSALIAGFAMVVMVEIQLPEDLPLVLLVLFGGSSAGVVGLMLIAMLNCTMVLIAILKYDCKERDPPFHHFWTTRCEDDWQFAYQAFTLGVPLFMCVLALMGWIIFHQFGPTERFTAASIVTLIAVTTSLWWFMEGVPKWGRFNRTQVAEGRQQQQQQYQGGGGGDHDPLHAGFHPLGVSARGDEHSGGKMVTPASVAAAPPSSGGGGGVEVGGGGSSSRAHGGFIPTSR